MKQVAVLECPIGNWAGRETARGLVRVLALGIFPGPSKQIFAFLTVYIFTTQPDFAK